MKNRLVLVTLSAMLLMAAINLARPDVSARGAVEAIVVTTVCPTVAGWEEYGAGSACEQGISNNNKGSGLASLAIAPDNTAIVAWQNRSASSAESEIYVRRFDGTAWVELGEGSASGEGISDNAGNSRVPSLAVGPDGMPIVAWEDNSSGNREIYVRRWDGVDWVEMGEDSAKGGGISKSSSISAYPSLAIAPDNTPLIAWEETTGSGVNLQTEIFVLRWDGEAWVEMGAGSASDGGISDPNDEISNLRAYPSLVIGSDGTTFIAWQNGQFNADDWEIYVLKWNGDTWVEVGAGSASGEGISKNLGSSRLPSVAIDLDGNPVIAWEDDSTGEEDINEIYVLRWDGAAWVEMGDDSAVGGGISDPANDLTDLNSVPSLAIGPDGATLIAWQHGKLGGNDWEIHVRRWDGAAWGEVNVGSASGGGISDNDGDSREPSLVIGPDNMPVIAWEDNSGPNEEIFVRRYPIVLPVCHTLTREHAGNGIDPVADPANSEGCSTDRYYAGESIALVAEPATGWQITGWTNTDDDTSTAASNTLTMPDADHTVGVAYDPVCFSLTLNHVGQGSDPLQSPPNSGPCSAGHYVVDEVILLTAEPEVQWEVVGWSGTDLDTSTAITNTVTMPPNEHTAGVIYAGNCFTLTVSHIGEGADPQPIPPGSPNCFVGQYVAGEVLLLTAAPAAGWRVIGWEGTDDDAKESALNSLTMPAADHIARVVYAEIPVPVFTIFTPHVIFGLEGETSR